MSSSKLFTKFSLGQAQLKSRIVMSPMTRSRAINNIPNDLIAEYYAQRATAGLIITEGTSPSLNGLGYCRIPGIFNKEQVAGWKKVTKAVHDKGSKIFVQLMHTGRVCHPLNFPDPNASIVAPSAVTAKGQMWTDQKGLQDFPAPQELTSQGIKDIIADFVKSSELAVEAGFDGVELHGANGYLFEQFLHPGSNNRKDEYGQNRIKFYTDVASAVANKIKPEKVGLRLSPCSKFNDINGVYDGVDKIYGSLAKELNKLNLVYLHVMRSQDPAFPGVMKQIRDNFKGTMIMAGGYDLKGANTDLNSGLCDLVAFGRPYIGNPNLPYKLENNLPLVESDPNTYYTPGLQGFTDYK